MECIPYLFLRWIHRAVTRGRDHSTMQRNQSISWNGDMALVPALVGQVYQEASAAERGRLLEQLVRPLGLLSLVAVARGIFARLMLGRDGRETTVRPEDTRDIDAADVVSLAQRAQQVSMPAFDHLTPMLATQLHATGSAAARQLLEILAQDAALRVASPDLDEAGISPPNSPD